MKPPRRPVTQCDCCCVCVSVWLWEHRQRRLHGVCATVEVPAVQVARLLLNEWLLQFRNYGFIV